MKKILAFLLAMLMMLSLFGCEQDNWEPDETEKPETTEKADSGETEDPTEPPETDASEPDETDPAKPEPEGQKSQPVLYRVTDDAGNVIWLFGSIHVGREDYYPLPQSVMDAYNDSDALAVEFDIVAYESDMSAQMNSMGAMLYLDGTSISDHIPEELYDQAVAIMEAYGIYNELLDYYIPAFWSSMIDSIRNEEMGLRLDLGIDRHFLELAKDDGKEILDVESADFQYGMMAGFSPELQTYLLEASVEGYNDQATVAEELDEMLDLWASGDAEAFNAYLNQEQEFESAEEEKLYEEYNNALTVSRNETMTQWAIEALASGKEVFMVVGAAHIMGEGAIAENLRALGYTVEQVWETYETVI